MPVLSFLLDDILECRQLFLYFFQLFSGVGIEENFGKQVVVFRE